MLIEFINEYGLQLMYMAVTAIFGWLGIVAKNAVNKIITDKTKKDVAKSTVKYVEQVYKDLHGEEKLQQALVAASQILAEKGITVTDLELRVLIEAALAEFNEAFNNAAGETVE